MASVPPSPVTPADRLAFTVIVALLAHALVVFGIRFVQPVTKSAPTLEVTLVAAESKHAPKRADFLAQAQQEGSGTLEEARLLSTRQRMALPGQGAGRQTQPAAPGKALAAEVAPRRVSTRARAPEQTPSPVPERQPETVPSEAEIMDAEIAALEARLSASRQAYARRPRVRTLAAVSARADAWAGYVEQFRERVEAAGNRHYPAAARAAQLQGQVRLLVALAPDGRVLRIQRLQSSGHAVLDRAAEDSVYQAQPFPRFPARLQGEVDILQVVRTWRFAETLDTTQ